MCAPLLLGPRTGCHISSIPRIPWTLITDRLIRAETTSVASILDRVSSFYPSSSSFYFLFISIRCVFGASSLSQIAARWPRAPVNKRLSSDASKNRIHSGRLVSPFFLFSSSLFSSLSRSLAISSPYLYSAFVSWLPSALSSSLSSSSLPSSLSLSWFFIFLHLSAVIFFHSYSPPSGTSCCRRDAPGINYKKSVPTRIGNVVPRRYAAGKRGDEANDIGLSKGPLFRHPVKRWPNKRSKGTAGVADSCSFLPFLRDSSSFVLKSREFGSLAKKSLNLKLRFTPISILRDDRGASITNTARRTFGSRKFIRRP